MEINGQTLELRMTRDIWELSAFLHPVIIFNQVTLVMPKSLISTKEKEAYTLEHNKELVY